MIIGSHCVQHGAGNNWAMLKSNFSTNVVIATALGCWGQLGVACFVIISAWFLADKNSIHSKKVIMIAFQTWVMSVTITLIMIFIGQKVSLKTFIKEFITPVYGQYWFITAYLIFYLTVPILQYLCNKLSVENHKKIFIVLTIIIPTYKVLFDGVVGNLGDFCYLFIATSYLKKKKNNFIERYSISGFIISFLFIIFSVITLNIVGTLTEKTFFMNQINRIFATRHILVYYMAISLFYIFKNYVTIGYSKVVNLAAKSTLGIYILHENILMRGGREEQISFLWDSVFKMDKYYSSSTFGVYMIGAVFLVFITCSLIEILRMKIIDNMIINKIKLFDKTCNQIDSLYKLFDIK